MLPLLITLKTTSSMFAGGRQRRVAWVTRGVSYRYVVMPRFAL